MGTERAQGCGLIHELKLLAVIWPHQARIQDFVVALHEHSLEFIRTMRGRTA